MITIRVYRSGGGPQANKVVKVHSPSTVLENRTNSTGSADFDFDRGKYTVYVDGKQVYRGTIADVQTVYI
jgi:hypothetical protein